MLNYLSRNFNQCVNHIALLHPGMDQERQLIEATVNLAQETPNLNVLQPLAKKLSEISNRAFGLSDVESIIAAYYPDRAYIACASAIYTQFFGIKDNPRAKAVFAMTDLDLDEAEFEGTAIDLLADRIHHIIINRNSKAMRYIAEVSLASMAEIINSVGVKGDVSQRDIQDVINTYHPRKTHPALRAA